MRSIGIALLCLISWNTWAVEIVKWERLPIAVPLQVGQERIVFIDRNVRVGMPASLRAQLRVQSNGGALYLRAKSTIEPTRLHLQDLSSGEIILLDIVATPAAENAPALEPMQIVRTGSVSVATAQAEQEQANRPPPQTPIPVVLTRYAAQNLYAPLRTVEPLHGVSQVRVDRSLDMDNLLPTLPIKATALGAWQLDDYWVTAVRLQNRSTTPLQLDPRLLQGDFIAATFQHQTLDAQGKATDTTALYLVTRKHGLAQALLPAMSPINASTNVPKIRRPIHEE